MKKDIKENEVSIVYKNGIKTKSIISNTTLKKIIWLLYSICYIKDISEIRIKINNQHFIKKENNVLNDIQNISNIKEINNTNKKLIYPKVN